MFVGPSVHTEQLGSHWTDFHKNWYLKIFRRAVENIQLSLKFDKNNKYFTWRRMFEYTYNISLNYDNEECFSQKL